jgi:hypothetical protein
MAVNNEAEGAMGTGVIDRRTLIKQAAVVGAVAWTAPVVAGSLWSPAAAGTLPSKCYKYQYNWALGPAGQNLQACANLEKAPAQSWTDACAPSLQQDGRRAGETPRGTSSNPLDRYKSNSVHPNSNCCKPKTPAGNEIHWFWGDAEGREMVDTWPSPECISIQTQVAGMIQSPACPTRQPTAGYRNGDTITFTIDHLRCPGCYFADAMIFFTTNPDACPDPPSTGISTSSNQAGDSAFFTSVQFRFPNSDGKWPIHFKFWIGCNLNWGTTDSVTGQPTPNQNVPHSQCRIPAAGAPAGTFPSQIHDKGPVVTVNV